MAHQAHNIPWNTLAGHLKFERNGGHFFPRQTDLFPRRLRQPASAGAEARDVQHFARVLARVIGEFVVTERAKYPAKYSYCNNESSTTISENSGRLFSAAVIDRNRPYLREWMNGNHPGKRTGEPDEARPWTAHGDDDPSSFSSLMYYHPLRDAELLENWLHHVGDAKDLTHHSYNEVVALLLVDDDGGGNNNNNGNDGGGGATAEGNGRTTANNMEPLLRLAQHPRVPLEELDRKALNCQTGFREATGLALRAYLCLNIVYCKSELWSGSGSVGSVNDDNDDGDDGRERRNKVARKQQQQQQRQQQPPHLELASLRNTLWIVSSRTRGDAVYIPHLRFLGLDNLKCLDPHAMVDPFADLGRLRAYLKECFRVLVWSDVLQREYAKPINWEIEVLYQLHVLYRLRGPLTYLEVWQQQHDDYRGIIWP